MFLCQDGPTPGILYEVDVPIMSNPECHDMFKKAGHEKRILDSFVCAGYSEGKKDSCEVLTYSDCRSVMFPFAILSLLYVNPC